MTRPLRILYVGDLSPEATSAHRMRALERLGHAVAGVDSTALSRFGGRLASALQLRLAAGPGIGRLNKAALARAEEFAPDVAWFDKPIFIAARTLRALRAKGVRLVQYNPDNPFGPRGDPGWRLYRKTVPEYDVVLVPRESGIADFAARGARDVRLMTFAYEPTLHFPPPPSWSDRDRAIDVSFIGSPYKGRAEFLLALAREHGVNLKVQGTRRMWARRLTAAEAETLDYSDAVYNEFYRESIWRARISLVFVTRENLDEIAGRAFEIAACQGFMLAERTEAFPRYFRPGAEVELFSNPAECAALIRRYLPDEAARARVAAAARARAEASGYGNDARLASVMTFLRERYPMLGG